MLYTLCLTLVHLLMHVHLEPWPMLLDHMVLYQPHFGQQCAYLAGPTHMANVSTTNQSL